MNKLRKLEQSEFEYMGWEAIARCLCEQYVKDLVEATNEPNPARRAAEITQTMAVNLVWVEKELEKLAEKF